MGIIFGVVGWRGSLREVREWIGFGKEGGVWGGWGFEGRGIK